jgi:hypothetical protein
MVMKKYIISIDHLELATVTRIWTEMLKCGSIETMMGKTTATAKGRKTTLDMAASAKNEIFGEKTIIASHPRDAGWPILGPERLLLVLKFEVMQIQPPIFYPRSPSWGLLWYLHDTYVLS